MDETKSLLTTVLWSLCNIVINKAIALFSETIRDRHILGAIFTPYAKYYDTVAGRRFYF